MIRSIAFIRNTLVTTAVANENLTPAPAQYPATGLGLALVCRMAELHGGTVRAESTFGQGSRFTVQLPWLGE